jgi:hypothetical protein
MTSTTSKPTPLRIMFDASEFELSHGRAPRGRGRWAFSMRRQPDPLSKDIHFSPGGMTLAEARKWFVARLRAMGVEGEHVIYILP